MIDHVIQFLQTYEGLGPKQKQMLITDLKEEFQKKEVQRTFFITKEEVTEEEDAYIVWEQIGDHAEALSDHTTREEAQHYIDLFNT